MQKDKKNKEQEKEKIISVPDTEEELAKLIDDLETGKIKKIKIIGLTMNVVSNNFLNFLIYLLINSLLISASFCIFQPVDFETHLFILVFILSFTALDYILKYITYKYFQKLILYTVSSIFIIENIISLLLSGLVVKMFFEISVHNIWLFVGSILTFLVVRFILLFLLKRR